MILQLERHGIKPLWALVILGAETSLGDPVMGGELAQRSNFGCIRASTKGPWADTADGTVSVRGIDWWTWPDAFFGIHAWGSYLSSRFNGEYLRLLAADDWEGFASLYYGKTVDDCAAYAASLRERADGIRKRASLAGYVL